MSEKSLFLPISRIPSVGEFLDILHIKPAGLAAQIFTTVYDQFFTWSTDLRVEYDRYYCVEYPTFVDYLKLSQDIFLKPAELEKAYILLIKEPYGVLEESYDDNVTDVVIECILKLENSHEG
jgi:hypothetical protein